MLPLFVISQVLKGNYSFKQRTELKCSVEFRLYNPVTLRSVDPLCSPAITLNETPGPAYTVEDVLKYA